jgi:hypothetical protein
MQVAKTATYVIKKLPKVTIAQWSKIRPIWSPWPEHDLELNVKSESFWQPGRAINLMHCFRFWRFRVLLSDNRSAACLKFIEKKKLKRI